MQTRLFVGNLSWNVSDADLADLAAPHGDVVDAKVITDRDTERHCQLYGQPITPAGTYAILGA